eukprot:8927220-Lingulodinium_polyedra.AAC.1
MHNRTAPITTTDHPVVHSGLYWTLQWAILEPTNGSITGSTTGSVLTTAVESTMGFHIVIYNGLLGRVCNCTR